MMMDDGGWRMESTQRGGEGGGGEDHNIHNSIAVSRVFCTTIWFTGTFILNQRSGHGERGSRLRWSLPPQCSARAGCETGADAAVGAHVWATVRHKRNINSEDVKL